MNFKKVLLSLSLCLILLTGSVFATTMSEADIKTAFNSAMSGVDLIDSSDYDMSVSEQIELTLSEFDMTLSELSNYIYFVQSYNYHRALYLFKVNPSLCTIDSITVGNDSISLNLSTTCYYYTSYVVSDDTDINSADHLSANSITISNISDSSFIGNTFDTIFTYSSNDIFTEPDSTNPDIFAGILATMTYILASITTVMNSLVQVDLILFVILASLTISIIYFVIKLLKGFTGNKLVNGKKRK